MCVLGVQCASMLVCELIMALWMEIPGTVLVMAVLVTTEILGGGGGGVVGVGTVVQCRLIVLRGVIRAGLSRGHSVCANRSVVKGSVVSVSSVSSMI